MALKSTIYKAQLNISDLDRHYYADHELTLALHPSETEERMMLRLLAFCRWADEQLSFGRGISTDDEPDLWKKSLSDEIEQWIDLGQPELKRLRRAAGRSHEQILITYGGNAAPIWWQKHQAECSKIDSLAVYTIDDQALASLNQLCDKNMSLQCTIESGQLWLSSAESSAEVSLRQWQ